MKTTIQLRSLCKSVRFGLAPLCVVWAALSFSIANASVIPGGTLSARTAEVRDLVAVNATTMLAATQGGGLWKTTDAGATWTAVASLPARYVWKIAVAGATSTFYAATSVGLFQSGDAGASWSQRTWDHARAIAVDPLDASGSTILVGVPGAGVLRSTDGGATLVDASQGLDSTDVRALVYDAAGNAYVALFGNANGGNWGGVFKLPHGASSWTNWNTAGGGTALENKFVTSLAVGSSVLLAGTEDPNTGDGKVHRALLGSPGWINPSTEGSGYLFGVESLVFDRSASGGADAFFAGSRSLCPYRSTDGGATWIRQAQVVSANTEICANLYAIGTFPSPTTNVVVAAKGQGLFYTPAPSASAIWTRSAGIEADRIRSLAASPTTNTFLVGVDGGGVMRSVDGGSSWTALHTGFPASNGITPMLLTIGALAVNPNDASQVFAGARGPGLYQLSGSTWSVVNGAGLPTQGSGDLKPQALRFDSAGTSLYYTLFDSGQGVYRRSGGGWSLVEPGAWGGAGAASLFTASTGSLLALMYDQLPARSTNGGATWTTVNANDSGFTRLAFVQVAENPFAPGQMLAVSNKGIFRSTDDGANWSRVAVSGALRQTTLSAILYSVASNALVFAADRGGNVYCSVDAGQMWSLVATLGAPVLDLRLQSTEVWAVTDGAGVIRMTGSCP